MRRFVCSLRQRVWQVALAAAVGIGSAAVAFAAPKKPVEPPKEPAYALEYGLVIFVVLLSLAIVFRPGRRTDLVDELKLPFGPKN